MALLDLQLQPRKDQLRWFGMLWFPALCLLVGLILTFRFGNAAAGRWAALVGLGGFCLGLAAPLLMSPVYILLLVVSFPIGLVISHLLVAFVYYLCITPIGLILRLTGRDALTRTLDPELGSYWVLRDGPPDSKRYFRQF